MILPVTSYDFLYEYLLRERDLCLQKVDQIERILKIYPRTAELRKAEKQERAGVVVQLEQKESETK